MSTSTSILQAIETALQGVSGLSAERVLRGFPGDGPSPPVAWVAADQLTSEPGPDLSGTSRVLSVSVWASPATDGSTHGAREDACFTLMDLMISAIESSSTLLNLLIAAPICGARADVAGAGGPGTPLIVVVVECRYQETYGDGV